VQERWVVCHTPEDELKRQAFKSKGLAFAYAKRKVPSNKCGFVEVVRQVEGQPTPGAFLDRSTGLYWLVIDSWTYHPDGNIEHSRS